MIIADNIVGNGESGLALANSNGLTVVRNFIGVDRKADGRGTWTRASTSSRRPREAAAERARQRQHDPLQRARRDHRLQRRPHDRQRQRGHRQRRRRQRPRRPQHDRPRQHRPEQLPSDTGVAVHSGVGNTITQNSIYGNQGLGIDLGPTASLRTTSGDVDTGPNDLQNFPVLTGASADGASLEVTYGLGSGRTPRTRSSSSPRRAVTRAATVKARPISAAGR